MGYLKRLLILPFLIIVGCIFLSWIITMWGFKITVSKEFPYFDKVTDWAEK